MKTQNEAAFEQENVFGRGAENTAYAQYFPARPSSIR